MKNLLLAFMIVFSNTINAQITITASDMVAVNDTFRVSIATNSQNYNFALTDTNYNWSFTMLTAIDQRLDDFVAVSSTPALYNLVFQYPLVATIAGKRPDAQIATVTMTNGFNFYKTSNTAFTEVGFGSIIQGIPLPVKYQTNDVLYHLPVVYDDIDSSFCSWNVSIPSLGSIYETRKRINHVDGWGTLTTPIGTYSCIRIKSEVFQRDSIRYDANPIPLPVIPQHYIEYIWLTQGKGVPVLKAIERAGSVQVEYLDTIKSFTGFEKQIANFNNNPEIVPNPANNYISVYYPDFDKLINLKIYSVDGRFIIEKSVFSEESVDISAMNSGLYFIQIIIDNQIITKKLIKY